MNSIIKDKPWLLNIIKQNDLNDILLINLYEYYLLNNNIHTIIPIISSNSKISIRIIDWFVTNYSKKNNIIYKLNNSDIVYFNVYFQYKCMLKSYKKKLFDPFCRKKRIAFYYDINKCIITTIGQLNFFKWILTYDILKYIDKNLYTIIDDMASVNNSHNYIKNYTEMNENIELTDSATLTSSSVIENKKSKRHFLSNDANKTINIHNYSVLLTFD